MYLIRLHKSESQTNLMQQLPQRYEGSEPINLLKTSFQRYLSNIVEDLGPLLNIVQLIA